MANRYPNTEFLAVSVGVVMAAGGAALYTTQHYRPAAA
jgi:hypothetical protein